MRLVDQFRKIEQTLPEDWTDARFLLCLADEGQCERAAAILAPIGAGRRRTEVRFYAARRGAGASADRVRRALRSLDDARIAGELELVSTGAAESVAETQRSTFAASWDAAVAALPPDWSDLYVEVELHSTDYLERAALLLSPVNPARYGGRPGFRFRCSRVAGYGVSAAMARRCLGRLDESRISGVVRILRALSETRHVYTQGPVWYVGGKPV